MIIILLVLVIFLIFIYIGYYKTSDTLEFNHMIIFNKDEFMKTKDNKNPLLFTLDNDFNVKFLDNYINHSIKYKCDNTVYVVKLNEYLNNKKYKKIKILMINQEFLENTLLNLKVNKIINYLENKEYINSLKNIYFLNKKSYSYMKYDIDDSIYIHLIKGKSHIKLFLPNHSRYIDEYYDEELNEYISDYDPWKIDMLESIDIYLYENNYLKIPRLWWYTFKGLSNNTIIGIYKTNTIVSNLMILPHRINYVRNLITT